MTIPERPGSFRAFCALLGKRSVTEFNYRYADPKVAHVFVGVAVREPRTRPTQLLAELRARAHRGARPLRQRDGEAARAPPGRRPRAVAADEMLYRFEFPERPGALMDFLDSMSAGWNISLFHYRNHGADYGRVLVGMQVPPRPTARLPPLPRPARLRLRRRDRQPRLSAVPRPLSAARARRDRGAATPTPPSGTPCRAAAPAHCKKLPQCCVSAPFSGGKCRFRQALCSRSIPACAMADSAQAGSRAR